MRYLYECVAISLSLCLCVYVYLCINNHSKFIKYCFNDILMYIHYPKPTVADFNELANRNHTFN